MHTVPSSEAPSSFWPLITPPLKHRIKPIGCGAAQAQGLLGLWPGMPGALLGPDGDASDARRRHWQSHSAPPPPPPPSTPPTPLAELRLLEPPREPLVLLPASQQHGETWALPSARSTHAVQMAAPKSRRRLRGGSGSAHQAVVWACLLAMALRAWQRRTARQIQARVARGGRAARSPHWAFVLCRPL